MLPREHYLKQSFQDVAHFPHGFEAGGLSSVQARLIRKYGMLISALLDDNVSDANSDDIHLLKTITTQGSPKTPVEQAWMKYQALIKQNPAAEPEKPAKSVKPKAPRTTKSSKVSVKATS